MAGVLLNNGQDHVLSVVFKTTAVQNYFLRLMTETSNPALSAQVGSGITEVTGTDYAAITLTRDTDWTGPSSNIVTSAQKTFTVGAGGWANVSGYFISLTSTGNDAIWAEAFPAGQQGNKIENDTVKPTLTFELKDDSE